MRRTLQLFVAIFVAFALAQPNFDPSKTLVSGNGFSSCTASTSNSFYITAKDASGNAVQCLTDDKLPYFKISLTKDKQNPVIGDVRSCDSTNPGVYFGSYIGPSIVGTWSFQAGYLYPNGSVISLGNVPHDVDAQAGPIDPSKTTANPPATSVAGEIRYFNITPSDKFGNVNKSCLINSWTIQLTGEGKSFPGKVESCDQNSGIILASYTTQATAIYDLTVKYQGQNIQSSPFRVTVSPGALDPSQCVVLGTGVHSAIAGQKATFNVIARDKYQNNLMTCENNLDNWKIDFGTSSVISGQFESCKSGTYVVSYSSNKADTYTYHLTYQGKQIANSPYTTIVAAEDIISPKTSYPEGSGIHYATAGVVQPYSIYIFDQYGNPLSDCESATQGWTFSMVSTTSSKKCDTPIISTCNPVGGFLTVQYTCYSAEKYTLKNEYNGELILNGSSEVTVTPASISPTHSIASGIGLQKAQAGVETFIQVDTYDQYDNKITLCEASPYSNWQLSLNLGSNNVIGVVDSCDKGNYKMHYTVSQTGTWLLIINYQGNYVQDPQFLVNVVPGPPAPGGCKAVGPGLVSAVVGESAFFNVTCSDKFSNPIYNCVDLGLSNWNASFINAQNSFFGVAFTCLNGTTALTPAETQFTYSYNVSGIYNLTIAYKMMAITLNPYVVTLYPGEFNAKTSWAEGPGVTSQSLVAGVKTVFNIIAADKYGNRLSNCSMDPKLITFNLTPVPLDAVTITGCTNGVTSVTYTPYIRGVETLNVKYDGQDIMRSPYHPAVIADDIFPGYTYATGAGMLNGIAGQNTTYTIIARDRFNNSANCDSANYFTVRLVLGGITVTGTVGDCQSGVYTSAYLATVAGVYHHTVDYKSTAISNSPWNTTVIAGPIDAGKCRASPDSLSFGAGFSGFFTVTCTDSFNNKVVRCDEAGKFSFLYSTNLSPAYVNCSTGGYLFSVTSTKVGDYVQGIAYDQKPIYNNVTVTVIAGPVVRTNTYLQYDTNLQVGVMANYYVFPKDRYNNSIYNCSIPFNATVKSSFKDYIPYNRYLGCSNAQYKYEYNVSRTGTYTIDVTLDGDDITNSPGILNAQAGPIYPGNSAVEVQQTITAGTQGTFTVDVYDRFNNSIVKCENISEQAWSEKIVEEPNNSNLKVVSCQQGAGKYNGVLTPYVAGVEHLIVSLNDQIIGGKSVPFTVIAGPIAANGSVAYPVDGFAGVKADFGIDVSDAYGNKITSCSEDPSNFAIRLDGPSTSCTTSASCADGRYQGHYTCTVTGEYNVTVSWKSGAVRTTPKTITVRAGPIDDAYTIAVGPGVSASPSIIAGHTTQFVIIAKDKFGNNNLTCPGYNYNITFNPLGHLEQTPIQTCDRGNTTVTYTQDKADTYLIYISGKSSAISGSPFTVHVIPGDLDPKHITNASAIIDHGSVGQSFSLPLSIRDKYDNPITGCNVNDTAYFKVLFSGDNGHVYVGSVACVNSVYYVNYVAQKPDVYSLIVTYKDSSVQFSPFHPIHIIYGSPDFGKCYARGPGVEAVPTPAGVLNLFQVYLVNEFNYSIDICYNVGSELIFDVSIKTPSVEAHFAHCYDGVYHFIFNATVATLYDVVIKINGSSILGNPYHALTVPGPICPQYTHVDGINASAIVPYEGWFLLIVEDCFHNHVSNLGNEFYAVLAPYCADSNVTCAANSTEKAINCTYEVAYGGIYCIEIVYNATYHLFLNSFEGLETPIVTPTDVTLDIIGGNACTEGCNNQGVCVKPNTCSCWTNRTGDACESTHSSKYMKLGLAIGLIIGLAILFFLIGLLVGYCAYKALNRGGGSSGTPLLH